MGILSFSKVVSATKEIKYKDLKGKRIAVDAYMEVYRAMLGMSSIKGLTTVNDVPTQHINVIISVILNLYAGGAQSYWVFDYNETDEKELEQFHNPMKLLELKKRKEKRDEALKKIEELKKIVPSIDIITKKDDLFSDSDEESKDENKTKPIDHKKNEDELNKQEKIAFKMKDEYLLDIKFLLDCFEIPWVDAPKGYEAEQFAAILTNQHKCGIDEQMDYVLSSDMDTLLFGAKNVIKRDTRKKKMFEYNLNSILKNDAIGTMDNLIKMGLVLGTDFAPKTPRIGAKTVLKKLDSIELSDEQKKAMELFKKKISPDDIKTLKWHNIDTKPLTNKDKIEELLVWLEIEKNFNRARIEKLINKALDADLNKANKVKKSKK